MKNIRLSTTPIVNVVAPVARFNRYRRRLRATSVFPTCGHTVAAWWVVFLFSLGNIDRTIGAGMIRSSRGSIGSAIKIQLNICAAKLRPGTTEWEQCVYISRTEDGMPVRWHDHELAKALHSRQDGATRHVAVSEGPGHLATDLTTKGPVAGSWRGTSMLDPPATGILYTRISRYIMHICMDTVESGVSAGLPMQDMEFVHGHAWVRC